jgi:hypothetical protein
METPMVYAVSDTSKPNAAGRTARARAPTARAAARSGHITIHWPRLIALGLNAAAWILIIVIVRAFLRL